MLRIQNLSFYHRCNGSHLKYLNRERYKVTNVVLKEYSGSYGEMRWKEMNVNVGRTIGTNLKSISIVQPIDGLDSDFGGCCQGIFF